MAMFLLHTLKKILGVIVGNIPKEKREDASQKIWDLFIQLVEACVEAGARGVTAEAANQIKGEKWK